MLCLFTFIQVNKHPCINAQTLDSFATNHKVGVRIPHAAPLDLRAFPMEGFFVRRMCEAEFCVAHWCPPSFTSEHPKEDTGKHIANEPASWEGEDPRKDHLFRNVPIDCVYIL